MRPNPDRAPNVLWTDRVLQKADVADDRRGVLDELEQVGTLPMLQLAKTGEEAACPVLLHF